jgi:hypothetical protein
MFEAGRGDEPRAARLLGAFETAGSSPMGWPLEGFCLGPDQATLRARFEHEPFVAAIAEGRMLTVDQALDEALADALDSPGSEPLTAREREGAAMVAVGHTDR